MTGSGGTGPAGHRDGGDTAALQLRTASADETRAVGAALAGTVQQQLAAMGLRPDADLSPLGRVVIILLMYLGRIGFMTFALALVVEHPAREIRYPAEDVVIG